MGVNSVYVGDGKVNPGLMALKAMPPKCVARFAPGYKTVEREHRPGVFQMQYTDFGGYGFPLGRTVRHRDGRLYRVHPETGQYLNMQRSDNG